MMMMMMTIVTTDQLHAAMPASVPFSSQNVSPNSVDTSPEISSAAAHTQLTTMTHLHSHSYFHTCFRKFGWPPSTLLSLLAAHSSQFSLLLLLRFFFLLLPPSPPLFPLLPSSVRHLHHQRALLLDFETQSACVCCCWILRAC